MSDWTTANLKLRADRDALNEAQRREAAAACVPGCGNVFADLGLPDAADARLAAGDCLCATGTVCRHNAACPRL